MSTQAELSTTASAPGKGVGLPWCDVCGTPVERMDMRHDPLVCRTMFRVFCHGDEDTGWLEDADLVSDGAIGGHAFRVKRLLQTSI